MTFDKQQLKHRFNFTDFVNFVKLINFIWFIKFCNLINAIKFIKIGRQRSSISTQIRHIFNKLPNEQIY